MTIYYILLAFLVVINITSGRDKESELAFYYFLIAFLSTGIPFRFFGLYPESVINYYLILGSVSFLLTVSYCTLVITKGLLVAAICEIGQVGIMMISALQGGYVDSIGSISTILNYLGLEALMFGWVTGGRDNKNNVIFERPLSFDRFSRAIYNKYLPRSQEEAQR